MNHPFNVDTLLQQGPSVRATARGGPLLDVVGELCEPCKPTSTVDTVFISNMGCSVPASFWYVILLSRTVLVRLFVLPAHDQWRVGSAWEGVRARDGRTVRVSR